MEKFKSLNRYQKAILLFMTGMLLVFGILYSITISRVGFSYKNTILVPNQEEGRTTYSGKIKGKQAIFTVSEDKTVHFQYANKLYGPYTAKEDPTAVPRHHNAPVSHLTGIVVYHGEEAIFCGGVEKMGDQYWLVNKAGTLANTVTVYATTSNGTTLVDGNLVDEIDLMKPSIETILDLMNGPNLTHKGDWPIWLGGVVVCLINAISILFADEIFRFNLSFQIRDTDHVEPSDWEIAGRYIGWTIIPILVLILYIIGIVQI